MKQKILITLFSAIVYGLIVVIFVVIGETRILPCQIKCDLSKSYISTEIPPEVQHMVANFEASKSCSLHGININKFNCTINPTIYTSNIIYTGFYLLILPFIITFALTKFIWKKIKK